jgi:hypothetical protein
MFRSLFRGREDVFARRWESLKTGKAGYSPAFATEWDPVLCGKARGPGSSGKTAAASVLPERSWQTA